MQTQTCEHKHSNAGMQTQGGRRELATANMQTPMDETRTRVARACGCAPACEGAHTLNYISTWAHGDAHARIQARTRTGTSTHEYVHAHLHACSITYTRLPSVPKFPPTTPSLDFVVVLLYIRWIFFFHGVVYGSPQKTENWIIYEGLLQIKFGHSPRVQALRLMAPDCVPSCVETVPRLRLILSG